MIKVNTFKKRSDELYANRPKNQGGLLGGAEFAAKSLAAGVGSIGEGVVDIFGAAGNLIVGDVEGAKDMFRNNVVGDWYAAEREEYNPDVVMSFIGDTLHGIGQSAVLFIPYAGAPLFYTGIVSQGVSSAAAITGEVGLKEIAYGVTTGALEGVIDKALGGTASKISNAVKGIGKNAGKSTGKALFKATTDASRKGLMRKILSSGASEFAEEFVSEYADTLLQRAYRIDPTKQYSLKDAIYSGFVGMASGMVTTSAVEIPRSINYAKKGRSIIDRGNSQTLVNTATVVADKLANKGTNFKNAAGWVTALRGQVDAYNDLVKKGKGDSASAATILGEMQAYLSYAETKAVHAGLMEKIEKASDEDKAALAEYINMLVDKENRKKDYTAEDITNNTDEIASQLAIMQFAGMALDYESITKDDMREQEISEAIANERNTSTEEAPAATVEDAPFAEAMAKAEETPAQVAETVEIGQAVDTESAPAPAKTAADIKRGIKNATNKIEVQGKLYEISEANIDDISNRAENLIKSGVSETDAVAQAIDEGLSDIRSLDEGGKLSPVFAKARIAKIKGAIINAYRQGVQNEAKKAAREAKLAEDTETHKTEETATEEKNVPEAETKTEAPNTSNYIKIKGAIVPNKSAQATKTKEAPKQQNTKVEEKSSDRTNESSENKTEPPKVSEAKESLTDEQRAERARKKAKEMLEWELNNTPTVNELNTAREYVKGFDNLSPERRQSIIRMMRTTKGIDVKIVKGIANLMAIKAGTDLDLRFDEEVSEYGVSVKSEGRTLIIISSKTDFKETVEGTVVHELVHYLENKSGYKAFAEHVMKRVKPEKKKEVEEQVTKQYNERYEQIYRKEYTKQGLKGAELNKAVKDALESKEHKAMIDSEVVAVLVGQALNSDKFLSRYARIGNTDGFIKKAYTFLRAMVKELKSKDKENNELADIIMPTIKSMDRLLQMPTVKDAESGKRYLFAGDKADIADKLKLATAKKMLKSGVDSETVRKETGWFKGYDGKWRFEIDDSKYKVDLGEFSSSNKFTLGDIVIHDDLFKSYPELKNITVKRSQLPDGENAIYYQAARTIIINDKLDYADVKKTLVHEIQHVIQAIEGFTSGTEVKPISEDMQNHLYVLKAEQKKVSDELDAIYKEIKFNEYSESLWEKVWNQEITEEEAIKLEKEYLSKNSRKAYLLYEYQQKLYEMVKEAQDEITKAEHEAYETYKNTAGEIEARNAAERINFSAEERKNTRPDIDREDVVFAEGNNVAQSIEKTTDNRPVVVVNDDILKGVYGRSEEIAAVKQALTRFDKVPVHKQIILITGDSANEVTRSKQTETIRKKNKTIYEDKMRVMNHPVDIVLASTDFINEAPKHPRKDDIIDFARGSILLQVHGRQYSAEVVYGYTKKRTCRLHDIVKIVPDSFTIKKTSNSLSLDRNNAEYRRNESLANNSIPQKSDLSTPSQKKYSLAAKESQTNAKEAVFGKSGEAEKIPASRVVQSTVKYSLAKAGELAENTTKYNDKHGATDPSALKRGIDTMKRMASLMQLYLDKPGVLPPDVIGKTAWKNGSYGRTMENTTLCIRTLTYEYFKDEVAKAIGRPLTVSESLLASQKIYDIATYPQCIYCYVAADRKSYDAFIGEYVADMDKYIKLLKKGGDSNALYEEYLHGRKSTKVQEKRWAEWKRIAKSGESYIKASDINTRSKRNELVNKGGKTAAQVKDAMRYAQSASWAKSVSDYVAYNGDILKFSDKMIDMLNSEYGLRMYSFSDYTPAFIVENMQMVLDAAARGLKVLSYTKDADYVRIFGKSGMAINMSCFAKYDSKSGTYVEDSRQGMKWDEVKELRAKYKNAGAVMVVTNDKMLEWALKQDWIDVVIPYHIVKTGTTIAGAYEWRNYTRESADYSDGKTANIYPVEHNNDFKTFRKLAEQRGITPRFKEWYDKAVSGEISGDLYMKLVNEVRLPANKLSPVQPNFDLQAAMDSFGVDASGNAIKGGYVDLGGYMGNWFKKGVDVEQEVKTVAEDIQSGKTVSDVTYGRQSVREVPKIQKQYSLAPKKAQTNAKKTDPELLNEKGEVKDAYFAQAVERMYQRELDAKDRTIEAYKVGNRNQEKEIKRYKQLYEKALSEGTKQKNYDFVEIFELRSRLRELGYDFEAERKKVERVLAQNEKQKEMLKDAKQENRDIIRKMENEVYLAKTIAEVQTREAARLAKELAKRREEFGKYYSAAPIKREVMNIVERGEVSKLFGGTYTPTIEGVSANDVAEYIAINLNIKGDDGETANRIVRVAAEDLIRRMKFVDAESGEAKYLENIVDEATYKQFVESAEGDIAEMLRNAGTVNPYSKLVRDYEKKIAQYVKEEEQSKERKAYGEQLPKTYQEALKMRKLEKRGAAGFSENIEALAKKFAGLVDESGHLHLSRIDDAMNILSEFIAKEELKNADERTRLKIDDAETMTDFASDDAMLALLKALVENYKHNRLGTNPSQMQTAEDLKNVEEIIKVLRKYVEEYGKEYFNGHYVDAAALAEQAVKNAFDVSKSREYKTKTGELLGTKLKKLGDAYFYRILTPETIIGSLEGFEKDAVLTKLYHQIRVASDKRNTMAMRMTKPFVEFFESKEHRWQDKGLPMSYDQKLQKKMISINGTDIRLDDAIYLYCLTKDPDSYVGLAENGFITHNEDGQREHTIKIEDIESTRSNIANQFDDVDVEFVKLVEGFFNGTATKIKYDADVKIFGVSNNRDTYYIPIYRYKYARMRNVADARASIAETITAFNKSFTHNRVANNTAIESSGIANIIYTHANSLADYSELYLPLKAFDRIYNRAVPLENGEIRSARDVMNNQVWKGTDQFLQDLFKDIQGQGERRDNALESAVGAIRGFWVSSVLGANLKVCTTQLTSLVAATQVIDPKYITMASPKVATPDKALGERADKYSDIIEERSFDNEAMKAQGNLQKIGKIGKITGMGIEFVDRRVCLTIFHAAELQVQDQKGYAVGTEENAKLAAKLADETIRTTQSMSDAAEKSALQRSKSEIGKLFSMFTSDTVKNLSHAYGNVMKYMAHKRRAAADPDGTVYQEMLKKDAKDLRRSARTLLMTGVMLGLIAQGFKWLFDELEDDPEERQKDFAMDIASSTLNIFPVASDFIDKLVLGYDMSLNVLDVANDTIDAIKNGAGVISRSMSGEYVSEDEIKRAASNAGTRLISFFGIPIEPARRTVTGLIRRLSPETIYGYDTMRYVASYSADLQAAIESGDEALAEAVIKQLYQDEASGTYTTHELEEIVRLYTLTDEDGNHYNVLPKRTLKKMDDDTELNAAQRKQFNSIYSQASAKVNELIRSEEYKMLDDKAKAKAIRDTYELYYNRAAAEVIGKEWSANQAYSKLTDNYTVLMASKAYKSSLEAYKTDSGKEVTVKEQFSQYVKNLNLSDNDYLIVAYANGYKGKKTTRALLKYINSLDLNEAEKRQIAKALNFDLKNGQFTEKED